MEIHVLIHFIKTKASEVWVFGEEGLLRKEEPTSPSTVDYEWCFYTAGGVSIWHQAFFFYHYGGMGFGLKDLNVETVPSFDRYLRQQGHTA